MCVLLCLRFGRDKQQLNFTMGRGASLTKKKKKLRKTNIFFLKMELCRKIHVEMRVQEKDFDAFL